MGALKIHLIYELIGTTTESKHKGHKSKETCSFTLTTEQKIWWMVKNLWQEHEKWNENVLNLLFAIPMPAPIPFLTWIYIANT